ncbi:uncharacterized protein A1O5_08182 [Cladophialophora psammophila CBS 110553]|uniref:Uncharacterized protein n=1 Tax=Cladophialophora psammophila CBS 110553 TaxID=1182543 RepID=W9WTQ6_9EURO|nr:uncharacterized protein A1O5_08182 [Cladophialophora psammophila CBS 110553]EXJ68390.1 hypothetical protein A1O5_08182 [Cladophialophora psammophila CBS 110553]
MKRLTLALALAEVAVSFASPLARGTVYPRQSFPSEFNPDPQSGFDDPTIDIADPSFATAIQAGYQGPFASYEQHELVGPVDLLRNGHVNYGVNPNFTLPLYRGLSAANTTYWWIVTDTSDEGNAKQLGVNFAPKLRFAAQGQTSSGLKGAEQLEIVNNTVGGREGMVDFSPVRSIVPGDLSPFPPKSVQPGSVGDRKYTPLIQLTNAGYEVWNAPIIAGEVDEEYLNQFCDGIPSNLLAEFRSKVHDQVLSICPRDQVVTLATIRGFSFSKSVLYLIADGSDPLPATLDGGTYAPRLAAVRTGDDDALFSGIERFFVNTNGYTNRDLPPGAPNNETHHPWRQGLNSAILGDGNPLNILGAIPTVAYDYSPLWDFNLFTWTNYSIENGIRTRLTGEFEVLGMAAAGYVTNPDGTPLSDAGIVNNCPIVHRFL